jgi:hypothetical protein
MFTVVIFSVVILSLSGLAFQVARRTTRATDQALSMSVLLSRVDRASTIHFDSLAIIARCDTTTRGVVRIYACVRADSLTAVLKQVRVVVSTSISGSLPDTVAFLRGRIRRPVPLR